MNTLCPDLVCEKCNSEKEIIVDRNVKGEVVRIGDKIFTTKPTHRSRFCYYHNRKRRGRFDDNWKKQSYGIFNLPRKRSPKE